MKCEHERMISPQPSHTSGCAECLSAGTEWLHLRLCLTCGHVGCCDSSPGKHARRHSHNAGHPIAASFEPGERWAWCYDDEMMVDLPDEAFAYLK